MNKETLDQWYGGLKSRLSDGTITQSAYELTIVDNLHSIITRYVRNMHHANAIPADDHFKLIDHFFELIADAEISETNVRRIMCSVASSISALPAAQVFGKKHNAPMPPLAFLINKPPRTNPFPKEGMIRKKVASTTEVMVGRPVITQFNKESNEVTIELPWNVALHVYKGFLVKHLASKLGCSFSDAYQYIEDHQNKYNSILEEALNSIISHKESHLVSAGGGITAAGSGLVVSGIIKPEE